MFALLFVFVFFAGSMAVDDGYSQQQQSPIMWFLEAPEPIEQRSLRSAFRLEKKERSFGDRASHFPFYKGLGRRK